MAEAGEPTGTPKTEVVAEEKESEQTVIIVVSGSGGAVLLAIIIGLVLYIKKLKGSNAQITHQPVQLVNETTISNGSMIYNGNETQDQGEASQAYHEINILQTKVDRKNASVDPKLDATTPDSESPKAKKPSISTG